MDNDCLIVLPARLGSTRLPEKLLRDVAGKTVLQHTYDAARQSQIAGDIIVAVDHQRLADAVESFGGRWIMTSPDCASGTDRIAEVAAKLPDVKTFVNVQADEPEIDPRTIDQVGRALLDDPDADIATAGTPIRSERTLQDPSCVKIVLAREQDAGGAGQGRAIYFSRSVVPHVRDGIDENRLADDPPTHWHHIGLYAYRREFLQWFATQPPSTLEQLEKLEQLRAIEAGKRIIVVRVESATPGIDTEEDLKAFIGRRTKADRNGS